MMRQLGLTRMFRRHGDVLLEKVETLKKVIHNQLKQFFSQL